MPEAPEVEKLRRTLDAAWRGRRVRSFTAPAASPNPKKYVQGDWTEFSATVRAHELGAVRRVAKHLWIPLTGTDLAWSIHLNSTGWFLPAGSRTDPIDENFIHSFSPKTVRLKLFLDDGQEWHYHDGRTWGKWELRKGKEPRDNDYFATYGPDWLESPGEAGERLKGTNSKRTLKDILCNQKITCGLGNYLACEAAWRAGLHPHRQWNTITTADRHALCRVIVELLGTCMERSDHSHWAVFLKAGQPCPRCERKIEYAKDGVGARGSYYCGACQPQQAGGSYESLGRSQPG